MSLNREAAIEVAQFLNEPANRDRFAERLDSWSVATDALEQAGFIHHAQQIRSLIRLASDQRFPFDEYRTLDELRLEARDLLTGDLAPREIWGQVVETEDGLFFDSIYARGFRSVPVEEVSAKRLPSGERLTFYRAVYAGHLYSGRSHDRGYLRLYRQSRVPRTPRLRRRRSA